MATCSNGKCKLPVFDSYRTCKKCRARSRRNYKPTPRLPHQHFLKRNVREFVEDMFKIAEDERR